MVTVNTETALSIFKGKKVFVTGHTGFKGSWLITWLGLLEAQIMGYALPPDNSESIYNRVNGDKICESVFADVRDKEQLQQEIQNFQPDFVFHLAAQPLVRASYADPLGTYDVNVMGTANLLNAIRLVKKSCSVVIITTDKVYENNEWAYPYREVDRLGGYDPYSASKACTEIVLDSFRRSFFNPAKLDDHGISIASARAGNVIGGGDWSVDRIIPDIVRNLTLDQPIPIRNPGAIRPWQHVLEPIYGYLLLAYRLYTDPLKYSGAYNFGPYPTDVLSVDQLALKAIELWGKGSVVLPDTSTQPHEARILKLDIAKTIDHLNWTPKLNSVEAIEWTVNWYKQPKEKQNDFTLQQIRDYHHLNEI